MKYSFLEFDEQKIKKDLFKLNDTFSSFEIAVYSRGAEAQHTKDVAIMKRLIEIIEMQKLELESNKKSLDWYANTFAGWETNSHEFEHFRRVELPSQIDETLAAVESKLKELK